MSKIKESKSAALKEAVIKGMQDLKAKDVVCIDLRKIHGAVCDFFVICHGDSTTQVEAIAGSVYKVAHETLKEKPWHEEGRTNSEWILLDYVDVVAHVFYREARDFYNIEELWSDAPIERIEDDSLVQATGKKKD